MTHVIPSKEDIVTAIKDRKQPLVYTCVPVDTDTPVSAYLKLCHDQTYAFLYESVEGAKTVGRYSAIGFDPDMLWTINDKKSTYTNILTERYVTSDTPLDDLKIRLEESRVEAPTEDLPPMLHSGLFGYMGYDTIGLVEDIPTHENDTLDIPDTIMIRPRTVLVFDNVFHKLWIAAPAYKTYDANPETTYEACEKRIHTVLMDLRKALPHDTVMLD